MKRIMHPAIILAIALALLVTPGMAKKHAPERGWLGVYTQSVDYEVAEAFDLGVQYGAVINKVMDDSPAKKAGLESGDVLVALNGEKVTDSDDLIDLMAETKPGDNLEITFVRDGREKKITVTAGEPRKEKHVIWTDKHAGKAPKVLHRSAEKYGYMGVYLDDLNEQLGRYFGVEEGNGALVSRVEEDSPAEQAGLKAGDVIISIDEREIEDSQDVTKIMRKHEKGDHVTVVVLRDHRETRFDVELGEKERSSGGWIFGGDFEMPDIVMPDLPKMKGLYLGDFDARDFEIEIDEEELEKNMQELKRELKDLRILKLNLHDEIEVDKDALRSELQELRDELKKLRDELKQELKELNERDD